MNRSGSPPLNDPQPYEIPVKHCSDNATRWGHPCHVDTFLVTLFISTACSYVRTQIFLGMSKIIHLSLVRDENKAFL